MQSTIKENREEVLNGDPVLTAVESILPKGRLTVTLGDLTVGAEAAATLRGLADFTD